MKFGFHPAAEVEHLDQVVFYEAQQVGLGQRYLAQVESAIERICEFPNLYRIDRLPDIRRASVMEFPFHLVFRDRHDVIQILAVAHYRRRPRYWLSRL